MIYDTSVTVVIISPGMKRSEWMEWEIEYSLKVISRQGRASRTNSVVGVIMKVNGSYDWIMSHSTQQDGCSNRYLNSNYLFEIIKSNRFNCITSDKFYCERCKSYDRLKGSYFSLVEEGEFLANPTFYIENAYEKSQNLWKYDLTKQA